MNKEYFNGVGRRKNSTARVYLSDGNGKYPFNNVQETLILLFQYIFHDILCLEFSIILILAYHIGELLFEH